MMLYSKNSKYNKLTWLFSNLTIQVCSDEKAANMVNHTLKGWKMGIQGRLRNIHILSVCFFLPVCGGEGMYTHMCTGVSGGQRSTMGAFLSCSHFYF